MELRQADQRDRVALAHLIHASSHLHRHLGWRSPLDWLGTTHPYLVMLQADRLVAALACSLEIPKWGWIQLFVVSNQVSVDEAWRKLWSRLRRHLGTGISIIALPMQEWFEGILQACDFVCRNEIAVLQWTDAGQRIQVPKRDPHMLTSDDDLDEIYTLDQRSFKPAWQQTRDQIAIAHQEAVHATAVGQRGSLLGYQISTTNAGDGHLARLAVLPEARNQGVGHALVADALLYFRSDNIGRVTVNTQVDNMPSLALYQKMGFRRCAETYSVYQYDHV